MQTDNTKSNTNKTAKQEWGSFAFVICIALLIRILIMEPFTVPTGSMKATILENDYIFSTKYSYGYSNYSLSFFDFIPLFQGRIFAREPERGDIVVFRPPNNMSVRYIKRLIGLPGDKIQLIDDVIYINDKKIERTEVGTYISEEGIKYLKFKETLPNGRTYFSYKLAPIYGVIYNDRYGNTDVFYIPEGKYFFLGDNRDQSNDSRVNLGFVPFENFIAKAQFIWFSTKITWWDNDIGVINLVLKLKPWIESVRLNRIFRNLYNTDA
ncbi:signal peptidase I [Rickettsia conorii]|uniref:signal peptidase I n=1 Tax=Rickettsia conorii TaxID=781 RepID=UPI002260E650|nr:signal peptidase I [Rickettsia conorii]UZW38841.1 signal peptidase I [Rickettsia conorii subsp. heilongjiangensis]